jgi:hypothetical protein
MIQPAVAESFIAGWPAGFAALASEEPAGITFSLKFQQPENLQTMLQEQA